MNAAMRRLRGLALLVCMVAVPSLHGQGFLSAGALRGDWRYEGEMRDWRPRGQGVMRWADG